MEWQGPLSKMASSNFLDDVLNTEADESAVSALVGSLESQLSSSTSQAVLVDASNANVNVNVNTNHAFRSGSSPATLAGNGSHATSTCTPTSTCNITPTTTASNLQHPNSGIHSLLPNGNPTGLVVGHQFGGNSSSLPNGTISSGSATTMALSGLVIPQQQKLANQQQQSAMIIPPKATGTAQQTVIGTNGTATNSQLIRPATQLQQPQQTVINSAGGILPGVQVVNMNTVRAAAAQNVQSLTTVTNPNHRALAPRVVLTQQQVGVRPGQVGITLQALQAAGAQGHLLVKTETGQYQLLRVGPGPVTGAAVAGPTATSNVTAMQTAVTMPQAAQTVPATSVQNPPAVGATYRLQVPVGTAMQPQPAVVTTVAAPVSATTSSVPSTTSTSGQMTPDTAKVKCKNFLSTLLRLASEQPESVATNVRMLIQGLVDGRVEPEEFTTKLQRELNSSPQPCLIPFLKKSLPYLRHSLATKELTIDGIQPPPVSSVTPPVAVQAVTAQQPSVVNRTAIPSQVQAVRPLTAPIRTQTPIPSSTAIPSPRPTKVQPSGKSTPKQTKAQQAAKVTSIKATDTNSQESTPISFTITLPQGGSTASTASTAPTIAVGTPSKPGSVVGIGLNAVIKGPSTFKEKKAPAFSSSLVGLSGDDDINDVAAMGGVNLAEESQRILGSTEMIGTQIRSCKDENFLFTGPLQKKIQEIVSRHGLGETSSEVVSLISHATQERLKTILEKLAVIAEHRMEVLKTDSRYEVQQDVKGQLKFLEELDKLERRRHSEIQREMLLKAAKSRSKAEDPEQAKLKAKAKEMQRAEMEELRQREANLTALQAIGQRKRPKLDFAGTTGSFNQVPLRPRVKRVNLRDLLFLMEEEKETVRSPLLYKAYLK